MSDSIRPISESLYAEACNLMPGGVNSPVRAFKAVGGTPVFFKSAKGSRLFDTDGNEYIDYVSSWGAILLGHELSGLSPRRLETAQALERLTRVKCGWPEKSLIEFQPSSAFAS